MFKYIKYLIFGLFFFAAMPSLAQEKTVDLYLFYGQGCPHCAKEELFLDRYEKENKALRTHRYEVWYNEANQKLFNDLSRAYNWNVQGVPLTVVGNKIVSGYYDDQTTGEEIKADIASCQADGCADLVGNYLRGTVADAGNKQTKAVSRVSLPIFGQLDVKRFSLPILTIIIAALDGLNPCALWVLLFLIGMLVGMQERKKLLVLGSAFILASAVFYYFILAAWLNFIIFVGLIFWLRTIIGAVAIYSGYYYIKKWIDQDKVCHSVDEEKRKKIFARVKDIIARDRIWLALGGIIIVAISVNAFKLLCSAGLPAVYAQILSMSGINRWQYYAYLFLYVLVFEIYEIIILGFALATFKIKAINPKFVLRMGLVGGIIMLIIGLLLIFKPAWLMFG